MQALADNENGALHHACDPFQSTYAKNAGLRNVEAAGLSGLLRFQEAFPEVVFPDLPRLQFAFIDASHLFDLSMLDFVLVDKKLDIGGVVAFHDLWMPSLRKVIRFLLANRGYEIICATTQTAAGGGVRSLAKHFMSRFLRVLPRANDIFCPELLEPWEEFGIGNLALLRKTSDDSRDWRHFQRF